MKSSFMPQFNGLLHRKEGYDESGHSYFGKSEKVRFSYVRFRGQMQGTSIRSDKSGSKERATELQADLRIIMYPSTEPDFEDELELDDGKRYRIKEIIPRYEMINLLNHYQMDLERVA